MKEQEQEKLVESIHYYVTDNFPLANMSDEDAKNDYVNMRKSLQTYVGDRYGEATDTAYAMKTKADDVAKLAQSGMDALDAM